MYNVNDDRSEQSPYAPPGYTGEPASRHAVHREPLLRSADESPTGIRFGVLAWLCAAALIAYIHRNSIGAAEKVISDDLGLSAKEMGVVMSAFFLSYSVMQIPTGWLCHVWGSRRALPVFSLAWSAATGAMGMCGGFWSLCASRVANGGAQAGLFPGAASTISKWFPPAGRGLPNGALGSFMSIGGAVGMALTGVLLGWMSWQAIFFVYALLGLAWAAGFYSWFRDLPGQHDAVNDAELLRIAAGRPQSETDAAGDDADEPTPWLAIFSSVSMWWICGQQFFRAAGYIFFATWFPRYLQETRGISVKESALYTALPLIGVVVGSLLGGVVMDWIFARTGSRRLSRQGLAVASMLACAGLVFAAYFIEAAMPAVTVISAAAFCAAVGGPVAYTVTIDMGDRHVATVFSTMNMSGNIGALAFPMVVPWVEDWYDWSSVLLLFGAMYVGAAACWMLLRPSGTVFDSSLIRAGRKRRV